MPQTMLIKVLVNLAVFLIILAGSLILFKKIKFESPGYKFIFIVYTIFWIAPMMLRSYAGTLQKAIDNDFTWIALACYGMVGIVARVFGDYLNFNFKSRKAFLYFSCVIQLALYIPVIIVPNTATSILQSIGVGVGASCIASFQLLFKEQHNPQRSYLTVSLLAIPPLMANFLTAPLQSILMQIANQNELTDPNILKYMWAIGLVFTLIAFILMFYVKEDRAKFDAQQTVNFKFKKDGSGFIILCVLGMLISFIKFSNSGSVGTLHLQTLGDYANNRDIVSAYEGYLSVVFSVFQLIGSILVGTYLVKRLNNMNVFLVGAVAWIIYLIAVMFIKDPLGYFFVHSLNGFGYGVLYNFILGSVLATSFNRKQITPMGLYQSILSIGIALSGAITQLVKNNLNQDDYFKANTDLDLILLSLVVLMTILYAANWYFKEVYPKYRKPITQTVI